jgi:hypothetical protein
VLIIHYTFLVGSLLLDMLFLLGDRDVPAGSPVPDRWTSVDSLRAMAHLGEPVQGQARDGRFTRTETTSLEPDNRIELAQVATQENPVIMNAEASMDCRKAASRPAAKPRMARVAARPARVRAAVAENAPPAAMEMFRLPSW